MSILFSNIPVVTLDASRIPLKDAFVAVEGEKISYVGQSRPEG